MAKKEETISLIDTFSEFKELKNIDRTTMVSVLEESFRSVIAKMFGTDENYDVIVNPDKGDFEIWRNREVVADEDLTNPNMQISLSEAQKIDASYEEGEEVTDEVIFAKFGRRAILNLRQTLASKILELEKDSIYNKYIDKVGTIINAEVYQIWKKEMLLLDDEGNELLLPKTEQIPSDFYRKGETARAVVARVDNKNNNPKIILSRTSPVFLQRLFEMEVPEINDGLITIKKIARIPGERAKIAVESYDDRIDPVGACVGVKGSRIHGIVRELRNENIDVINYTSNISLFIQRALSPAKISSIRLNEEEKKAEVFLKPEEVFEEAFIRHCRWTPSAARPYVVNADPGLVDRLYDEEHTIKGVTLTAVGFYGPQGRVLRLPLAMPGINDRITAFRYEGYKVTNYEMESAAITGLCNLLGHRAATICLIIANRINGDASADYHSYMNKLIRYTLEKLS